MVVTAHLGGRRAFFLFVCLRKGAIDSNPLNAKHKPQIALVMILVLRVCFVLLCVFNLVCPVVDELLLERRGRRGRVSELHLK